MFRSWLKGPIQNFFSSLDSSLTQDFFVLSGRSDKHLAKKASNVCDVTQYAYPECQVTKYTYSLAMNLVTLIK
jgi:hypothetical protein